MTVFFDLDHTLLRKSSGEIYGRYLFEKGQLPLAQIFRIAWWAMQHRLNLLDIDSFLMRSTAWIKTKREAWIRETCTDCVEATVSNFFYPKALQVIESHQKKGNPVYLLSASVRYFVEPVVEMLSLDGCIATELEVKAGKFTGNLLPPFCYGEGKWKRLEKFCKERDIDIGHTSYYGDSFSDLPVLERVAHPVVVNPDKALGREARRRSWPVLIF